jgi:PIN domain nuclease of toxin-antitoxin system
MRIICDTNALIYWADRPERLSPRAREALQRGAKERSLACSDISLWEIAMLFAKGRLKQTAPVSPAEYMREIIDGLRLALLPIAPEIAELSQADIFSHGDPADRLIAATALHYRAPLITSDRTLRSRNELETIW